MENCTSTTIANFSWWMVSMALLQLKRYSMFFSFAVCSFLHSAALTHSSIGSVKRCGGNSQIPWNWFMLGMKLIDLGMGNPHFFDRRKCLSRFPWEHFWQVVFIKHLATLRKYIENTIVGAKVLHKLSFEQHLQVILEFFNFFAETKHGYKNQWYGKRESRSFKAGSQQCGDKFGARKSENFRQWNSDMGQRKNLMMLFEKCVYSRHVCIDFF